jgi:hypothetical protein
MKKILSIFAITVVFAACNNNPKTGADTAASLTATDTATANHNAFTDKAREIQLSGVSDTIVSSDGSTYVKVTPKDSEAAPAKSAPAVTERSTVHHTATRTRRSGSTGSGSGAGTSKSDNGTVSNSTSGTNGTETTSTTTTETKKKGWSKAAKGAVIGAGTGAAAGAIISKKKGKGAIIGGIIGGAGGYIIGRSKDKKDGRY